MTHRSRSKHAAVSDHALVRYLQRVKGFDVEAIRAEMLGEGRGRMIEQLRTCKVPVGGGQFLVALDGLVVTVSARDRRK